MSDFVHSSPRRWGVVVSARRPGTDGRGHRIVGFAAVICVVAALASSACSAPPDPDLSGTTGTYGVVVNRNIEILLEDGRVLRADLYEPTDPDTGERLDGPFPVIVGFTPYGKSGAAQADVPGANGVNLSLVRHGYIAAAVDIPGTGASDGAFDLFDPAEAVAGAGVVDWAAQLPRSSGSVGMLGLSYLAIVQLFTAAEVGPDSPLRAIFPMSATVDPYRDLFVSGGAINLLSPAGLLFGYGVTRTITPFTEHHDDLPEALRRASAHLEQMSNFEAVIAADIASNGERRYDGEWWEMRRPERILQRIADNGVAVYLTGGLYDVFQRGTPRIYNGLQNAAAGRPVEAPMVKGQPVTDRFQFLTGPWTHGGLGAGIDMTQLQLEWFDRWLKDAPPAEPLAGGAPMQVIEPDGTSYRARNYPLESATTQQLWLHGDTTLSTSAPTGAEPGVDLDYVPIGPMCTASTVQFAAGLWAKECLRPMTRARRTLNEVTYTTDPLEQDLQLSGPMSLGVNMSSNRAETLLSVTVEDVARNGRSMHLSGGAVQGSLRTIDEDRSWRDHDGNLLVPWSPLTEASSVPVPTGVPVRYDIEIRPAFVTVPAGHRLRIRISTADFPHLIPVGDAAKLAGGRYELHHSAQSPSVLTMSVVASP